LVEPVVAALADTGGDGTRRYGEATT